MSDLNFGIYLIMSDSIVLDDEELQKIYTWVDEIPLSRPKRNITRDFSDGGEM